MLFNHIHTVSKVMILFFIKKTCNKQRWFFFNKIMYIKKYIQKQRQILSCQCERFCHFLVDIWLKQVPVYSLWLTSLGSTIYPYSNMTRVLPLSPGVYQIVHVSFKSCFRRDICLPVPFQFYVFFPYHLNMFCYRHNVVS